MAWLKKYVSAILLTHFKRFCLFKQTGAEPRLNIILTRPEQDNDSALLFANVMPPA